MTDAGKSPRARNRASAPARSSARGARKRVGAEPTAAELTQQSIQQSVVDGAVDGKQLAELVALQSISEASADAVASILEGGAPDDVARLESALRRPASAKGLKRTSDELADDWRNGGYPYKYKMLRTDYEKQKFALQAELLKLPG